VVPGQAICRPFPVARQGRTGTSRGHRVHRRKTILIIVKAPEPEGTETRAIESSEGRGHLRNGDWRMSNKLANVASIAAFACLALGFGYAEWRASQSPKPGSPSERAAQQKRATAVYAD
jgi:hypothetical protein